MDDRVADLIRKAESAIDRNDLDQAEAYRVLAGHVAFLQHKEARAIARMVNAGGTDD